jgi:uncharacterized membrane protein
MGITLLTFGGLLAPLQQFAAWLASAPVRAPQHQAVRLAAVPAVRAPLRARRPLRAVRPVRVVRVVDGCQAAAGAGRMVISGRMADVCAELDRLAAIEARQACPRRH